MYVKDILKRENNNFDLLRIIAALLVIYGHSNVFVTKKTHDFLNHYIFYDYSGGVSVKVFFFLSGLFVTNSILVKRNPFGFAISRIFRIFPALIFVVFLTTFLIGAIFTNLSLAEYYSNQETYSYFYKNVLLFLSYSLPGVFSSNLSAGVNGSLWSLPYEFYSYALLLCLFVFGIFKNRNLATLIGIGIIIDAFMGNKFIFTWIQPNDIDRQFLCLSFAFGCLLALWKDKVKINIELILSSFIICYLFRNTSLTPYLMYISIFLTLIYLFTRNFIVHLKPRYDLSYGVYLWGWVIQQIWVSLMPGLSSLKLTVLSSFSSVLVGYLSWKIVEKPFINYGKKLSKVFDNKENKTFL